MSIRGVGINEAVSLAYWAAAASICSPAEKVEFTNYLGHVRTFHRFL